MFTIHKYRIGPPAGLHSVEMPAGATVLSVGVDHPDGRVCLWALVDTEAPLTARLIYAATTGAPLPLDIPERMTRARVSDVLGKDGRSPFRGTAVSKAGDVVHVFEV